MLHLSHVILPFCQAVAVGGTEGAKCSKKKIIKNMYVQLQFDLLTLLHRFFCVVGDRDDPIGTGYFVLLQTKVCQLGCALHVSGDQGVPIGPQAGQGRGLPPLLPAVCQLAQVGH